MKQATSRQEFPLAPLPRWIWAFLGGLWVALLLVAFLGGPHQQSPGNPVPWWLMVLFGTALLPAGLLSALSHREIRLDGDRLVVAAALVFARKVPLGELCVEKARVIDLDEHTEFRPLLRLWGFGLPGFQAGHYLLRNRARAFVLLTRKGKVLVLPQRDGKYLLLSPEKPQALLDALRAD